MDAYPLPTPEPKPLTGLTHLDVISKAVQQPISQKTEPPDTSALITLKELQKKVLEHEPDGVTRLEDLQICAEQLVSNTATLITSPINMFSQWTIEMRARDLLHALCVAFAAYDREISEPAELWGENTEPSLEMLKAKLVRYSSNFYACVFAYPNTALESNLDYDLRQYLMFLYVFMKKIGMDLMVEALALYVQYEFDYNNQ